MTEAPKRIWITKYADGSMSIAWYHGETRNLSLGMEDIPYVQTKIADKMLAALRHARDNCIPYPDQMIDEAIAAYSGMVFSNGTENVE